MRENANRFEGLAEAYAAWRPGYPSASFETLARAVRSDRRIAVDIGAGPGNSTLGLRAALPSDWLVIAAEPGSDMRRVLARRFAQDTGVQVIDACAEAIALPDASAGLLLACTAFHWFDRGPFFAEAARVLTPLGVLGILRNRRKAHPVAAAFDAWIAETSVDISDYAAREKRKEPSVRELAREPGFMAAQSRTWCWTQEIDCRGLIDLYLTRSTVWAIVRRIGLAETMQSLQTICAAHGTGPYLLEWETTAKWALRRP